jgi:hypothetical protein
MCFVVPANCFYYSIDYFDDYQLLIGDYVKRSGYGSYYEISVIISRNGRAEARKFSVRAVMLRAVL